MCEGCGVCVGETGEGATLAQLGRGWCIVGA